MSLNKIALLIDSVLVAVVIGLWVFWDIAIDPPLSMLIGAVWAAAWIGAYREICEESECKG